MISDFMKQVIERLYFPLTSNDPDVLAGPEHSDFYLKMGLSDLAKRISKQEMIECSRPALGLSREQINKAIEDVYDPRWR